MSSESATLRVCAAALLLASACGHDAPNDSGGGPPDAAIIAAPAVADAGGVHGHDPSTDAAASASAPEPSRDASLPASQDAAAPASQDAAAGAGDAGAPSDCPHALLGFASLAGDGVQTTTGGGTSAPVRPRSAEELIAYASDETPRVIELVGTFEVPLLDVRSDKTLVGIGADATLRGGLRIRGKADAQVHNVIVRNLRVDGATSAADGDAVQLNFAHHVWIDHVEIFDGPDGNLDMSHAVNWVTVSWSKLRHSAAYQPLPGESADHRFASLIGHSDNNASEDAGRLKITLHHNFWGERVLERMPRVRFGQVHVFNEYFASHGNHYCVRAGRAAQLLVESSYFDAVANPHEFNNSADQATAHITARNNVYHGTTGDTSTGGGGPAFDRAPYVVAMHAPEDLPTLVPACAGPR